MERYGFTVFWSAEDAAYIASPPDFPEVSGFGDTVEAAMLEARTALDLAIETYRDEGWELPQPTQLQQFSGQLRVRMPKSLHASLARRADLDGVSLNTLILTFLAEAHARAV